MSNEKRKRRSSRKALQRKEKDAHKSRKTTAKRKNGRGKKKSVVLTQERLKIFLKYNRKTGHFVRRIAVGGGRHHGRCVAGSRAGCLTPNGYWAIMIEGKTYYAHRLAWLYVYGFWPSGDIDHRNHKTNDNGIKNLRDGATSQNLENQIKPHSNNTSGFLGVFRSFEGWYSRITANKKRYNLGSFADPKIAFEHYLKAKRNLHKFNML